MSAEQAAADAVLDALAAIPGINGAYPGPPVKASLPWIELGPVIAADWGTKDAAGREVRVTATIRDAGDTPARLHMLAAAAGAAIEGIPRDLPVWRVVGIAFLRSRIAGTGPGEWAAVIDYRLLMLASG